VRLMVFSLLLIGCASVPRPNTDICIVNAPAKHRKCYNLLKDYDDEGNLKPGAAASYKPASKIEDLNKNATTDPKGLANLKAYLRKLREESKSRCQ
jgi:hypothetical protein